MSKPVLFHISYSPWSERARWALSHHKVEHERKHYLPMVGELSMRLKLGRPSEPVSVPLMFVDGGVIDDSYGIALYAEKHGSGTPLFPVGYAATIAAYNEHAQRILAAGRVCATARTMRNQDALKESLPKRLGSLGPLSLVAAKYGVKMLESKYGLRENDEDRLRKTMRGDLLKLRAALAASDGYLCGSFSYADILMAGALPFVRPVAQEYIRLGKNARICWADPVLADEFEDLLAWRDDLYASRR